MKKLYAAAGTYGYDRIIVGPYDREGINIAINSPDYRGYNLKVYELIETPTNDVPNPRTYRKEIS